MHLLSKITILFVVLYIPTSAAQQTSKTSGVNSPAFNVDGDKNHINIFYRTTVSPRPPTQEEDNSFVYHSLSPKPIDALLTKNIKIGTETPGIIEKEAQKKFSIGDFHGAAMLLSKAAKHKKEEKSYSSFEVAAKLYSQASLLMSSIDLIQALHFALEAQKTSPKNIDSIKQVSDVFLLKGDLDEAMNGYKTIADHKEKYSELTQANAAEYIKSYAHIKMGEIFLMNRNFQEAKSSFLNAIRILEQLTPKDISHQLQYNLMRLHAIINLDYTITESENVSLFDKITSKKNSLFSLVRDFLSPLIGKEKPTQTANLVLSEDESRHNILLAFFLLDAMGNKTFYSSPELSLSAYDYIINNKELVIGSAGAYHKKHIEHIIMEYNMKIGQLHLIKNQPSEAILFYKNYLSRAERSEPIYPTFKTSSHFAENIAKAQIELGCAYLQLGEHEKGVDYYKLAIDSYKDKYHDAPAFLWTAIERAIDKFNLNIGELNKKIIAGHLTYNEEWPEKNHLPGGVLGQDNSYYCHINQEERRINPFVDELELSYADFWDYMILEKYIINTSKYILASAKNNIAKENNEVMKKENTRMRKSIKELIKQVEEKNEALEKQLWKSK
ncbi:tetratricopeptide repeat protein [Rivihabitans pingtungensis]|uniref:tetratricopeptide repeat protein n=1 Tax=Rivihabitans pingtungensis TaxID=1054498 RepID=UPI002352DA40|nr:hypothetical protein [Rivihabitans pingtungensis]MCK6437787.1 hypothetical protein [Rivihabitans pingtungensis]